MKGYRALLEQCSLINVESMNQMKQQKAQLDRMVVAFTKADNQITINIKSIKNTIASIQSNSIKFLQKLNWQLDEFLHVFQDSSYQFSCGCGFATNISKQYTNHSLLQHKVCTSPQYSSHFVSHFGNVLFTDIKYSIHLQKKLYSNLDRIQQSHKTKLRKNSSKYVQQVIQQKKTKSLHLKQEPQIEQQPQKQEEIVYGEYFCGQCNKYFLSHRLFSYHVKSHDFMIHPNSSHIIVRRKNKPAETIKVKDFHRPKQRFVCACAPHKNLSHPQFIAHVFKWHKGITPRVI